MCQLMCEQTASPRGFESKFAPSENDVFPVSKRTCSESAREAIGLTVSRDANTRKIVTEALLHILSSRSGQRPPDRLNAGSQLRRRCRGLDSIEVTGSGVYSAAGRRAIATSAA